jgi:hypothetical protein
MLVCNIKNKFLKCTLLYTNCVGYFNLFWGINNITGFMKYLFSTFTLLVFTTLCHAQKYFACYTCINNPKIQISVCFENDTARYVKYINQSETMTLQYEESQEIDGGKNCYADSFIEIYRGEENGYYDISKCKLWNTVMYRRKKDNKSFEFKLNKTKSLIKGKYIITPCF